MIDFLVLFTVDIENSGKRHKCVNVENRTGDAYVEEKEAYEAMA